MMRNLTLLLAVVATAGLGGSVEAGPRTTRAAGIRPGNCMPFSGLADVTLMSAETGRACSIRVPVLVYEHPKVPGWPVFLLTIARGVHARGACLRPGLELEVSIGHFAQGGVGALVLGAPAFQLRAVPSALDRQKCLLTTFEWPTPRVTVRAEAWDEQHLQVITE